MEKDIPPTSDSLTSPAASASKTSPERARPDKSSRLITISENDIPHTRGEHAYNWLIGSSVYIGTYAASLASAYLFKYNRWGNQNLYMPLRGFLHDHVISNPIFGKARTAEEIAQNSDYVTEILSLMAGGSTPVIPFKMIEDQRINIIDSINEKYGSGLDNPELEALAQKRIDALPVQSWASALSGRGIAMAATLGAGIPFGKQIESAQVAIAKPLTEAASLGGRLYNPESNRANFLGKMLVMDGTWSAYTSAILLVFSRLAAAVIGDSKPLKPATYKITDPNGAAISTGTAALDTDMGPIIAEESSARISPNPQPKTAHPDKHISYALAQGRIAAEPQQKIEQFSH